MKRIARSLLLAIGLIAVSWAFAGFWYHLRSFQSDLAPYRFDEDFPFFFEVYYTMSGFSLSFCVLLAVAGALLVFRRSGHAGLFRLTMFMETLFAATVLGCWFVPLIGPSVSEATGVATGSLIPQFLVGFPIWSPFVAGWAVRRLERIAAEEAEKKESERVENTIEVRE